MIRSGPFHLWHGMVGVAAVAFACWLWTDPLLAAAALVALYVVGVAYLLCLVMMSGWRASRWLESPYRDVGRRPGPVAWLLRLGIMMTTTLVAGMVLLMAILLPVACALSGK